MEHIRDLLGHKNILTTQKYTHLSQNDLMFAMKDVATNMGFNTNDTNDNDKETK